MAGRPRIPTKLKIIRGTFRKDRSAAAEPEPTPVNAVPRPPAGLGTVGKREWRRLAGELVRSGILTTVDLAALEAVCFQAELVQELRAEIRGPGKHRTAGEYSKANPDGSAVRELRQATALYRLLLQEFGMTPSSRGKVSATKPPEAEPDPMVALLDAP